MKLVFCTKCRFVYLHPGDTPGKNGPKNPMPQCPQCFDTGGGGLQDVPADAMIRVMRDSFQAMLADALRDGRSLRRNSGSAESTHPAETGHSATFPIATTPAAATQQEDECRPE